MPSGGLGRASLHDQRYQTVTRCEYKRTKGTMASIDFSGVSKRFGGSHAARDLSFSVPKGLFFALLGPSGCGKTTVLRLIAGLERPDAGNISLDGRIVASDGACVPPEERNLGMVFQSYALWPHMTVERNIGFGLGGRGLSAAEQARRIDEALALVGLDEMGGRRPHQLSGGQRQRVALARSLAVRPSLILLDEPLANLDAHLRQTMIAEFRRIHREAATTFVFVTHDQGEAVALADLVAVMDGGRIEQIASPPDLYARPETPMVARFVGAGRTIPVEVLEAAEGTCCVRLGERVFEAQGRAGHGPGWLCLRARDIVVGAPEGMPRLDATVVDQRFEGGDYLLTLRLEGSDVPVETPSPTPTQPGTQLVVGLRGGWVLPRSA